MRLTADRHGTYIREDIIDPADEEYYRTNHPEMVSEDDMGGEPAVVKTKAKGKKPATKTKPAAKSGKSKGTKG